jgi:hypothetical protein
MAANNQVLKKLGVEMKTQITTLMVKNIPEKYTQRMLMDVFNHFGFDRCYDYIYLPVDFNRKVNIGYCFINLINAELCNEFRNFFKNFHLMIDPITDEWSTKLLQIVDAKVQGREANLRVMRRSAVMAKLYPPEHQPILIDADTGLEEPLPRSQAWPIETKVASRRLSVWEDIVEEGTDDDSDEFNVYGDDRRNSNAVPLTAAEFLETMHANIDDDEVRAEDPVLAMLNGDQSFYQEGDSSPATVSGSRRVSLIAPATSRRVSVREGTTSRRVSMVDAQRRASVSFDPSARRASIAEGRRTSVSFEPTARRQSIQAPEFIHTGGLKVIPNSPVFFLPKNSQGGFSNVMTEVLPQDTVVVDGTNSRRQSMQSCFTASRRASIAMPGPMPAYDHNGKRVSFVQGDLDHNTLLAKLQEVHGGIAHQ